MFLTSTLISTYLHLLAVCMAVGVMFVEDLTLFMSILFNMRAVNSDGTQRIQRKTFRLPGHIERNAVTGALAVLYVTGAWLIYIGTQARPDYLYNPKFIAKLALVAVLTLNAFVLHFYLFPRLRFEPDVLNWLRHHRARLVLTVSLSNSLWLYVAFLGIAREWSWHVSTAVVIAGAAVVWACMAGAITLVLRMAGVSSTVLKGHSS